MTSVCNTTMTRHHHLKLHVSHRLLIVGACFIILPFCSLMDYISSLLKKINDELFLFGVIIILLPSKGNILQVFCCIAWVVWVTLLYNKLVLGNLMCKKAKQANTINNYNYKELVLGNFTCKKTKQFT